MMEQEKFYKIKARKFVLIVIMVLAGSIAISQNDSIHIDHSKTIELSGLPFDYYFSLNAGIEFKKKKHSFVFSFEFTSPYKYYDPDFVYGINNTYRIYFRPFSKKFQPFVQASIFLFSFKSRPNNYDFKDWQVYGAALFYGIGLNHTLSNRISLGLSIYSGPGAAWGKTRDDPYYYQILNQTPPASHIQRENLGFYRSVFIIGYKISK